MSAVKRSRQRPDAVPAQRSSSQPASKRIKSSHLPPPSGLDFLLDEDARGGPKIQANLTNGVPRSLSSRVDESHAVMAQETDDSSDSAEEDEPRSQQQHPLKAVLDREVIAISSGEEESSDLEEDADEDDAADIEPDRVPAASRLTNGHALKGQLSRSVQQAEPVAEDQEMRDVKEEADSVDEPTFGDLLQARHPEPINLQKVLRDVDADSRGLVHAGGDKIIPTGHTLGTLLSQALKSNDKDMLETCLAMNDTNSIRATIQRQTSREAAILIEKIAERIHKRPGRTGNLMTWVQWALVCHGGYLAHQPDLMRKLRALTQIVRQRANGLQHLLHLKGKLDLLTAQLELRRGMQQASRTANMDSLDDEGAVLYIDGQDEDWSDSDDSAAEIPSSSRSRSRNLGKVALDQGSEDEDADAGLPNGIIQAGDDASSEEDEEDDDEGNGVLDMEAEEESEDEEDESSNEEADSEPSFAENDEDSEDEESEVEAIKQPKLNTLNRKR